MKKRIGMAIMLAGIFLIIGATGGYEAGGTFAECIKYWAWGAMMAAGGYGLTEKRKGEHHGRY